MRTKALLLAAAFAAAGVATSVAQVYSVNAVGYVNVTLNPGFNMVANPLDAGATGNQVGQLFKNIQGTIPGGYRIYILNSAGTYDIVAWDEFENTFPDSAASRTVIDPGNGVFVFVPGTTAMTLTFVGEVKQGTINNPIPVGFSIKANVVPQAGAPDTFGLPGGPGDRVYKFNQTTKLYDVTAYDEFDNRWGSAANPMPSIGVGEAFFMYRTGTAGTWTRTFNVNNPTN